MTTYRDTKLYRERHPEIYKARKVLYSARRNGTIKQQPCIKCGDKKSEAHHEDYSKPLDIIWVCKTHHRVYDSARRLRLKGAVDKVS